MIVVQLQDRLGNQMFQYAFGYGLSKRFKTKVFFKSVHKNQIANYFKLQKFEKLRNFFRPHDKKYEVVKQLGHEKPLEFKELLGDNCFYDGYFQSEKYFENIVLDLPKLFEIKSYYKKQFENAFGELYKKNKTICLHVRRTDYSNHNYLGHEEPNNDLSDIRLPLDYYWKCLSQKQFESYNKIIVSDDYSFAKREFGFLSNVYFGLDNEIIDFQLLLNANVVCVANSSFSWWAAWLNQRVDKVVYAPKYWFGIKTRDEYPVDIIPDGWIQIDCI